MVSFCKVIIAFKIPQAAAAPSVNPILLLTDPTNNGFGRFLQKTLFKAFNSAASSSCFEID